MDFFKDKQARKEKKEKKEKEKKAKKEKEKEKDKDNKKDKNSAKHSRHSSYNSDPLSSESSSPSQNSRDDYFADKESQHHNHTTVSSSSSFTVTTEDSNGIPRTKKVSITFQDTSPPPPASATSGPKGFLEFYEQSELEQLEQDLKPKTRERSKSQSLGYSSGSKSVPVLPTGSSKKDKEKESKVDRKKRASSLLKKEGSSTSLKSTEDSSGSQSGENSSRDNSKSSYGSPPTTRNDEKPPVYNAQGSHSSPNLGLKKHATSRKLHKLFGSEDQVEQQKTDYPKEQEEMHSLFDIPATEALISYFSFQKNGRLFITANYLCVVQGVIAESKVVISFRDVIAIEKKSGKRLTIGDTIDITTTMETHSFSGFFHNPMKVLEAVFAPWAQTNQSLHHAVKTDNIALVNALLENYAKLGIDIHKYDDEGQPALHMAIKNSNAPVVERLLEFYKKNQLDVNAVDKYGWTPLHCATFYCSGKQAEDIIVKALLEFQGISIDIETVDGNLPLHYFCQKFVNPSCTELGQLLTKKQSSVNKINKNGETPLHKAIFNNSVRMLMVELLIGAGADVNVPTITGETALHYAVHLGRRDLLKTLLHAGAGKSLKAKSKKNNATPLELATTIGQDKIAEILQKASDLMEWLTEMELERFFLKFFQEELYVDTLLEYVDSESKADMTIDSLKLDGLTMGARLTLRKALLGLRERYNRKMLSSQSDNNNTTKAGIEITSNTFEFKKKVKNARNPNKMAPNPVLVAKRMERIRSDLGVTDDASWYIKHEEIEFTKKIGSGTSGKVFKGLYKGRKVAIKVLKTEDQSVEEEFKKEFRVLSVLTSPHIVEFIGACFEPKLCMVMEFCSYGSLYHVLSHKDIKVDWDMAFKFAIEMIAGLNCLHTWNPPIFHRDMKSLNILVNENWEVKLTDFGLARFNTADNMRTLANMVGTIGWTAPELLSGSGYTASSDIYSAAIILWEIFSRVLNGSYQQPFKEFALNDQQIMILTMDKGLRPTIPSGCYPDLAALIRKAWDPEPSVRPDCVEIFSKLEDIHKVYFKNPAEWIAGVWSDGLSNDTISPPSTTATGADTLGSSAPTTQQSVGSLDAN